MTKNIQNHLQLAMLKVATLETLCQVIYYKLNSQLIQLTAQYNVRGNDRCETAEKIGKLFKLLILLQCLSVCEVFFNVIWSVKIDQNLHCESFFQNLINFLTRMLILFPLNISAKKACQDAFWVFEIKQIRLQNLAKFVILV